MVDLARYLRTIPDFPRQGINFVDLTPVLADADAFSASVESLLPDRFHAATVVAGVEARGFWFAPALAQRLGVGFVPLRKPGKLPSATQGVDYALEYGTDRLEAHTDAFTVDDQVLVVDDVLATGGTLAAACALVETVGANVLGAAVLIEIAMLEGRARLADVDVHSVMEV